MSSSAPHKEEKNRLSYCPRPGHCLLLGVLLFWSVYSSRQACWTVRPSTQHGHCLLARPSVKSWEEKNCLHTIYCTCACQSSPTCRLQTHPRLGHCWSARPSVYSGLVGAFVCPSTCCIARPHTLQPATYLRKSVPYIYVPPVNPSLSGRPSICREKAKVCQRPNRL